MVIEAETPSSRRVRTPYQGSSVLLGIRPEVPQPTVALVESGPRPLEVMSGIEQLTLDRQLFLLRKRFAVSMGMKKFSQRQLALKAGIDHSVISKLESGKDQDPSISVVVSLAEALELEPDSPQKLLLIASLAKERDRAYINGLLGLSGGHSDLWRRYALNTGISEAVRPVDKIIDYKNRSKRSQREIAEKGGIDHSFVSRLLSEKVKDISGSTFVAIVRGLGLITREQVLNLFDSFGNQRRVNDVSEVLEQEAS